MKQRNFNYLILQSNTKLPNGKNTPLVVEIPFLFSFGVSKRKNQETGKLTGYSIPVCLWKKDQEPNQEEQDFFNLLKNIHDICRSYLEKNYGEKKASSLGEILYYNKKEYTNSKGKTKKKKDETSAPVLYVKLIYSEKTK